MQLLYRTAADVPEAEIAAEPADPGEQPDVASKPEEVRGKIVDGRIQKWLAERVLVDQEWIHESGKKVEVVLKGIVVPRPSSFAASPVTEDLAPGQRDDTLGNLRGVQACRRSCRARR